MTDVKSRTEDWKTLPWRNIQRNVFRLQQRIYQAVYCSTLQCRTWPRNSHYARKGNASMDAQLFRKLYRWARFRHPRKNGGWSVNRYWKRKGERMNFGDGTAWLVKYADTPIKWHVKVRGDKSPRACPEPFVPGPCT